MKVLVACEFSATVREAFTRNGHNAWSCDIEPSEIPGQHIQDDIQNVDLTKFDLMIAHPPCTYLANSGVTWLVNDSERWEKMIAGAEFFKYLLTANVQYIAI